jgi:hypothetical protein
MSKIKSLQQALSQSSGKLVAAVAAAPDAQPANGNPARVARQSSRAGQVNISAWMEPNFKASLRLVQARKGGSVSFQDLMAEALNDLFIKYDVPTVRQE